MSAQGQDRVTARLFAAIDSALSPYGMLLDLSRIIAEMARPDAWAKHPLFAFDLSRQTVALGFVVAKRYEWACSELPIGQFPCPCPCPPSQPGDGKGKAADVSDVSDVSSLRVWTIRMEHARGWVFPGVVRRPSAPDYDLNYSPTAVTVCTHSKALHTGPSLKDIGMPHTDARVDPSGSLYQFTADLKAGTLRVRPTIACLNPQFVPLRKGQTEWTLLTGCSDLAEYRAAVSMQTSGECALLFC
jgi:hypothetical protein